MSAPTDRLLFREAIRNEIGAGARTNDSLSAQAKQVKRGATSCGYRWQDIQVATDTNARPVASDFIGLDASIRTGASSSKCNGIQLLRYPFSLKPVASMRSTAICRSSTFNLLLMSRQAWERSVSAYGFFEPWRVPSPFLCPLLVVKNGSMQRVRVAASMPILSTDHFPASPILPSQIAPSFICCTA